MIFTSNNIDYTFIVILHATIGIVVGFILGFSVGHRDFAAMRLRLKKTEEILDEN